MSGDLGNRFGDEAISALILTTVEQNGHFEADLEVRVVEGGRTHRVIARRNRASR